MIKNKQLLRQIKKSKITDFDNITKEQFEKLILMVETSYEEIDRNTYRIERALEVSSKELREFNDKLEEKVTFEVNKNREKDKKLLAQSRFAALGEMIGNIAHQWRQPLSAISSTASSAQLQLEIGMINEKELIESYTKIIDYVNFLSQTINDFRNFMKADNVKTNFNILDTLKKSISIIQASYDDNSIELNHSLIFDKKMISHGLPSELIHVIINILNNAKDATISDTIKEKRIHIRCEIINNFNTIYIQDNAGGIPLKIIDKIFDPYFTTKHQSQGTGIGLYMSKDIIEKHMNGILDVENINTTIDDKYYNGACFKIAIPSVKEWSPQEDSNL